MVQEYQSPVRVYKYPFELVMTVSQLNLSVKVTSIAHHLSDLIRCHRYAATLWISSEISALLKSVVVVVWNV